MSPAASEPSEALRGRTALVTGSAGGLGLAMAYALAGAGCHVVLHGLEPADQHGATSEAIAAAHGVQAFYEQADLADVRAIEALFDRVQRRLGGLDVLVNNAVTRHFAPVDEFPPEAWDRALAVNVSAAFHTIRLALPGMRRRGWGRIVNMTSVFGFRAVPNRIDYVTSKSALLGITRAVAVETLNQGITCNALCPGSVETPSIDARVQALMQAERLDRTEAERRFLEGKQPTGRFVESDHVAAMLLFLCGPAGRDITGAVLPVEGGWLAT